MVLINKKYYLKSTLKQITKGNNILEGVVSLNKHVTINCCSFIRLGISLSFSDNSADDSSVLVFSNVLSSKLKQFYLQVPIKAILLYIHNMVSVTPLCRYSGSTPQKQVWHLGGSWVGCLQIHMHTPPYRSAGKIPQLSLWPPRCPMPVSLDLCTRKNS